MDLQDTIFNLEGVLCQQIIYKSIIGKLTLLLSYQMHINDLLFQNLDATLLSTLSTLSPSNVCLLYQRIRVGNQQSPDESPQYTTRLLQLQLRKEYVLQVDISTKQIRSGFKCDIEVSFKIIRTLTGQSQQIGEITGIQFNCQKWEKKHVFLYVTDEEKQYHIQNLQSLQKNLGRNYIIQEGFHQIYRAIKKIGKGVTASVYKALRLTDHKEVAVKSFKKQLYYKIDNGRGKIAFQKQFKVLTEMRCKYLCKLISVYESQNSIYIVMDILDKSLYNYLKQNGFPKLNAAKEMMVKLLIGLEHMHKKGYMHRDLKLQNIMIAQSGNLVQPVIIDYGLAENPNNHAFLYVKCGTPGYVAPQILGLKPNQIPSPPYSQACDVFSLGVIFYILLVGKTLFSGNDQKQVVKLNRQCNIDYEFKDVERLTDQMKDLLRKMLRKEPCQRSTVQQLLSHNFFEQVEILKEYHTRNTSISMEDAQQNLF